MKTKRKKISTGWQSYFDFSARERKGVLVLAVVISVQISVLIYLRNRPESFDLPDVKLFESLLVEKKNPEFSQELSRKDSLFNFDPNKLQADEWMLLGLSERQSASVIHYVQKGGKFKVKNDVSKIYGLQNSTFEKLKPFILLPDSISKSVKPEYNEKKSKFLIIEINSSDSALWDKLYGIGPVLASRIVRYRERLGGFNSIEQIKEVWGIQDSVFEKIDEHLELHDPPILRKIHLNSDSLSVLASHPYLNWKIARLIVNYREQHRFQSIGELSSLPLLTEENFRKLAPYLTTEF